MAVLSFIDPQWAIPLNTFLVLCLTVWQARVNSQVKKAHKAARDAKRAVGADHRNGTAVDTGERRRWDDNE